MLRCCPGNKQLQPTADRTPHPLDALQEISYVSRRRMDDASFSPDAVDADGLPLVYNEVRLAGHSCMCLQARQGHRCMRLQARVP